MSRACARPGCGRPAVATLSYAYGARAVWVDDLSEDKHPMTHDLCADHAEHTRVPKGWELRDRRQPVVPLTDRISA